jgi:ribonuclease BN (tRNA processing enzyme)
MAMAAMSRCGFFLKPVKLLAPGSQVSLKEQDAILTQQPILTVLGSGTALATKRRGCPGYHLQHGADSILLDCGSGTLRQLAFQDQKFQKVSKIFLSHPHLDHVADLIPLLFARRNPDLKEVSGLTVCGWQGFTRYYESLKQVYGRWIEDKRDLLSITELDSERHSYAHFQVQSLRVAHIPGALGYRLQFENGPTVAYSGDTDVCEAVVQLGKNADLLIIECSFPNHLKVKGHLTPAECGQIAREANCKRLLLSHFYPVCDDYDMAAMCRAHWDGEIIVAEDGLKLSFD